MLSIDLNCDLGEGMPNDALLMALISSANIACGGHAGDDDTMKRTVELAVKHNVVIGAHPSYPDKKNFGRVELLKNSLRIEDLTDIICTQITALASICTSFGTRLHHIKPHGALYNRAAWDEAVSDSICSSIVLINPALLLYGLSGSCMKTVADSNQLRFVSEVFADRTYQEDGRLTDRSDAGALIENETQVMTQVLNMIQHGIVISSTGKQVPIKADTICLHGDGTHAVPFSQMIYKELTKQNIQILPPLS